MTAKEKASRGESFRGAKQTIGDLPGVEGVHAPIINMALVSSNSVRKLVNQRFDDDRYWKSRKLSLVQVVPEVVILITTILVRILDGLS